MRLRLFRKFLGVEFDGLNPCSRLSVALEELVAKNTDEKRAGVTPVESRPGGRSLHERGRDEVFGVGRIRFQPTSHPVQNRELAAGDVLKSQRLAFRRRASPRRPAPRMAIDAGSGTGATVTVAIRVLGSHAGIIPTAPPTPGMMPP